MPYRVVAQIEKCDVEGQWLEDLDDQSEQLVEVETVAEAQEFLGRLGVLADEIERSRRRGGEGGDLSDEPKT